MFYPMMMDPVYLVTELIAVPAILFALYAQFKVKGTFERYSRVAARSGLTGAEAARRLLDRYGIRDVTIGAAGGWLGDHYDPRKKQLNLSDRVYNGHSLAALGVAAHETGHALQHSEKYGALALRSGLVPLTYTSQLAMPLAIAGYFFHSPTMILIGICLFSAFVAFTLITLPVEFNASSRAVQLLQDSGIVGFDEAPHVRAVLNAAALTYVAAAAVAISHLLRLVLLFTMSSRDD